MKLFLISEKSVEPTAEVLTIPEFKKIWDKCKNKADALAIFSYIYHLIDPKSLYSNYPNRKHQCQIDFIPNKQITGDIEEACKKYKALITTHEERLLESCLGACDKLSQYFDSIDFTIVDSKGNLVHDPHKLVTSLKSVKNVIQQIKELRIMMEKGQDEKEQTRGDKELNMFDAGLV